MLKWSIVFVGLLCWNTSFAQHEQVDRFFLLLSQLEFDSAKQIAAQEKDSLLRFEMLQLADVLFYEGQVARDSSKTSSYADEQKSPLTVINLLKRGYVNLYYERAKGNAYRHFYDAHQIAKRDGNPILIQACLLALLRYYNQEIGQDSHYHLPYLKQLESYQTSSTDRFWVVIYKMIFLTQSFQGVEDEYYRLSSDLDVVEGTLDPASPMLTYLYYEKALLVEHKKQTNEAILFYNKAIHQAKDYPFLRYHRFNANLRLMLIRTAQRDFTSARQNLINARKEIDRSDSLRSNYSLDMHAALLLKTQQKYDSAFDYLWRGSREQLQLGFTANSMEINRLNVELETQEKENANLSLRENRIWLLSALGGVALLFIASYLAYSNQRSKNRIVEKEKQMQSMKMEKLLKDQEILGIDAMLEGQERERQKIADDLHDNLGSLLTTLKFNFQGLLKKGDHGGSAQEQQLMQKTDELLQEAYQKVRAIAHANNAGVNAKEGLLPSIRNFVAKVSTFNSLSIEVEEFGLDDRLDNSMEILIFRIIQELITNVIKHAQATEVTIHLTKHDRVINLMVEDNGRGFDISQIKPGETMGLYSIQKKIENLDGQVTIDSIPSKGTTIIMDIPLK